MELAEIIRARFSGELIDNNVYFNIALQTVAVLIGGIVLWRLSARLHSKKQKERQRNQYFETEYGKHWRNKRR